MQLRKTVTVLFFDIADSTSLGETFDAEVLGRVLRRYFDEVRGVVERHGGRVEKFIGDAVVAVFGVPTAREDDALRALRAAAEIRERLELLNDDFEQNLGIRLGVRTGVSTGEVLVSGDGGEGLTVSSDTTNIAARLEQAAGAGEILIGGRTRVLGGKAIEVEELEPLVLRGRQSRSLPFACFACSRMSRRTGDGTTYRSSAAGTTLRSCRMRSVVPRRTPSASSRPWWERPGSGSHGWRGSSWRRSATRSAC